MKLESTVCPESAPAMSRARLTDYLELIKPRISMMVLLTVATGAILAAGRALDWLVLLHTLFGTALVAIGASAWNQLLERDTDVLMRRTEQRPLPSGRMHAIEVLILGTTSAVLGLTYLLVTTRQPLAVLVAAITFFSYVFLYTPLKRRTTLNTLIGAVPGALPPVIGWTAMRGTLDAEIMLLFVVMFLWQVPHFLAIAWIYREDYGRAGLKMLPVVDPSGRATGRQMVAYSLALIPASLTPLVFGQPSGMYLVGVLILGGGFLAFALAFDRWHTLGCARGVLRASLLYLPLFLALLLLDAK